MPPSNQRRPASGAALSLTDLSEDVGEKEPYLEQVPDTMGRSVVCEVQSRAPTIRGHAWSYYMSCRDGRPMLVLDRRKGDLVRIGGMIDVVVVEVHNGQVTLGLRCAPDNLASQDGNE